MSDTKTNSKTICLPFGNAEYYETILDDPKMFRNYINEQYAEHPELFPKDMSKGFDFHGFVESKKIKGFRIRRIRIRNSDNAYQIRPSFVMPYMVEMTDNIEKAVYLRRWNVPFEALAYVFGRDAMFWYRVTASLGRNSVVGTTAKSPEALPEHIAADEKHTRLSGEKVFVAVTAADGCLFGARLSASASTEELANAYNRFKEEAINVDPEYEPKSVNTDGWEPTQKAWKRLFPNIVIILCFLHGYLKIKDRCKKLKGFFKTAGEKVWRTYHSETLAQFSQRIRRLREWVQKNCDAGPAKDAVLNLCKNADRYKVAYQIPGAYRTSNMVDRLMNWQDRALYAMQYLHGMPESANLILSSMALIWNFHPYGNKLQKQNSEIRSPFYDLNGFCYHENWMENLLIAGSMGGWRQ